MGIFYNINIKREVFLGSHLDYLYFVEFIPTRLGRLFQRKKEERVYQCWNPLAFTWYRVNIDTKEAIYSFDIVYTSPFLSAKYSLDIQAAEKIRKLYKNKTKPKDKYESENLRFYGLMEEASKRELR